MRDYTRIDGYLDKIERQIYPQPQDEGHTQWANEAITYFSRKMSRVKNVLDLGCGEGFCQPAFEKLGYEYTGVSLQRDFYEAREKGLNVLDIDFSFLPFEEHSFDLLFSRHSLEHSPMPLLTLMEWKRVAARYVIVIVPAVEHWGYSGRNHYFVLHQGQWENLFKTVGFRVKSSYVRKEIMRPLIKDRREGYQDPPAVEVEYWYLLSR